MSRLSLKVKTLMTVLILFVKLGPIAIITLSLYITLRTVVIYLTLILIIYFVA